MGLSGRPAERMKVYGMGLVSNLGRFAKLSSPLATILVIGLLLRISLRDKNSYLNILKDLGDKFYVGIVWWKLKKRNA